MTKSGETHNFKAEDFVGEIEKYLGRGVLNYSIFNNKKPHGKVLTRYKKEGAEFVEPPIVGSLVSNIKKPKYILADLLDAGPFIRHNSRQKLAKVLAGLL